MDTPLRHQNLKKLKTLFLSTLYISAVTFGGGFVIVGFMRRKFVHDLHWIDEEEMLDFAALAQSCPGAVAVNAAILVGWKICGFAGMLTAVLGTILPPMIILSVISLFYSAFASSPLISAVLHGMEAGVAATVLDVACDLGMATVKTKSSLSIYLTFAPAPRTDWGEIIFNSPFSFSPHKIMPSLNMPLSLTGLRLATTTTSLPINSSGE